MELSYDQRSRFKTRLEIFLAKTCLQENPAVCVMIDLDTAREFL